MLCDLVSILLSHCPYQFSHPVRIEGHFWLVQWQEVGTILYQWLKSLRKNSAGSPNADIHSVINNNLMLWPEGRSGGRNISQALFMWSIWNIYFLIVQKQKSKNHHVQSDVISFLFSSVSSWNFHLLPCKNLHM